NDYRAAGVVNALTQKVLAETALLTLQHVAEGLQAAALAGSGYGAATAGAVVVDESVDSFLQHTLFVATDNFRRVQLDELLQAVVAVDDAAVQVVQVAGGETA